MREFIKALPLTVGLPIMIGAASVKPEDAASNIAAWAEWIGFHNLPLWLTNPHADDKVIAATVFAAAIYSFAVWGPHNRGRSVLGGKVNSWGPWALIIGGPIIGLLWLFLRHEVAQPRHEASHPADVQAVAQPEKVITNLTLQEFYEFYQGGRNAIQGARLAEPYIGLRSGHRAPHFFSVSRSGLLVYKPHNIRTFLTHNQR